MAKATGSFIKAMEINTFRETNDLLEFDMHPDLETDGIPKITLAEYLQTLEKNMLRVHIGRCVKILLEAASVDLEELHLRIPPESYREVADLVDLYNKGIKKLLLNPNREWGDNYSRLEAPVRRDIIRRDLHSILKACVDLQELELRGYILKAPEIRLLANGTRNVKILIIADVSLSASLFLLWAHGGRNLREVSLRPFDRIDLMGLSGLRQHPNLEKINLFLCQENAQYLAVIQPAWNLNPSIHMNIEIV